MNNQTALSISLPTSMDGEMHGSLPSDRPLPAHQQEADVVFVPETGVDFARHLRRLVTFLNVRKRLSEWLSSVISGAVSIL